MADGRKAGSSGGRHFTRKRLKKTKVADVVELSDSSSDTDDDDAPKTDKPTLKSVPNPEPNNMECPVCLQTCIHPARLPCSHIFCFLCLKGIVQQSRRCAMCRKEIPPDYLDQPDLLDASEPAVEKETEDGYQWFYEGRNGWWRFEERISKDLEEVRSLGMDSLETLICGTLYVIDLQALVQYNKDNPRRKRRIKRELASNVVVKGIAGIR